MNWIEAPLAALSRQPIGGYMPDQSPATEPTALTALALAAWSRYEPAEKAARWLGNQQCQEGSIGMREGADTPRWPTALAVLAWKAVDQQKRRYDSQIDRAISWTLSFSGEPVPAGDVLGHDTTLIAWPWVEGTHSWIEPTAMYVLALKATGHNDHPRTREAVQLLLDRQLPTGGCNYGNTIVLGQVLRPHLQPTGLAMLALAGEQDPGHRIHRSLAYLEKTLSARTATPSLCWGLMGLAAHGRFPQQAENWLEEAARRSQIHRPNQCKNALLALAALGLQCPLVQLTEKLREAHLEQKKKQPI